jgi:hypothetical protein
MIGVRLPMAIYKAINWEAGKTPAYIFLIMIATIIAVMLPYTILNDYVTQVFYNMAINNGGDPALFNLIRAYWTTFFIIGFTISLVIWAVVNSMRTEEF